MDDFYLNLLDWSSTNVLAVALDNRVLLWNATDQTVHPLMECTAEDEKITSVGWMADGIHLALGTSHATIELWDIAACKLVRTMRGSHSARVSALAWHEHVLASGSRDSAVVQHDVRKAKHQMCVSAGVHTQEICGLKWSLDGTQLASGVWLGCAVLCCVSPHSCVCVCVCQAVTTIWCVCGTPHSPQRRATPSPTLRRR